MAISNSIRKLYQQFRSDPHSTEILGALSGAFFIGGIVSLSIEYAASRYWTLAMLLTAASGALAIWIAMLTLRGIQSISMVLVFFIISVLLGAVACAGISFILHTRGWARYNTPQQVTIETFRNYYLWTFLDMVPAIDIWKSIPVKSPVEPIDVVAGGPVLAFRAFILGFVFVSIRRWWKFQSADNPIKPRTDVYPSC